MNDKEWKKINDHISNNFDKKNKIQEIDFSKIDNQFIANMDENKIYKTTFTCIAVDIINSKSLAKHIDYNELSRIYIEFSYGINKILSIYGSKYIKIQGDGIYAIFKSETPDEIDNVMDCCVELNTFKYHLNKRIYKDIFNETWDVEDVYVDYGIGAFYSDENYVIKVGNKSSKDLVFIGDAVNYANTFAKIAGRDNHQPIIVSDLIYENFSKSYKKQNNVYRSFEKVYLEDLNIEAYENHWTFTKYINWIKNNA